MGRNQKPAYSYKYKGTGGITKQHLKVNKWTSTICGVIMLIGMLHIIALIATSINSAKPASTESFIITVVIMATVYYICYLINEFYGTGPKRS